jgi:peptidoglycan/xylan/chitin deacetylase (PgdA/CDA1 family)
MESHPTSDASSSGWRRGSAAVAVLSFDVDAESPILAMGGQYAANPMVMTHQAFGPLVGVPRILALLDEYALRATFFVPGWTADRYPETVAAIVERGHEVGHHSYSHHSPVRLDEAGERADFERALAALERVGVRPAGYRAATWEPSWRSPGLVAEYGLAYDSSLMDADTPYLLETASGIIAELPPYWALDDWAQYGFLLDPPIGTHIEPPGKVVDMWTRELDAMRRHGCLFMLTNHPFISGRPGRLEGLRRLIEHILGCGDVEVLTGAEVASRISGDPSATRRRVEPVVVDPELYP